MGAASVLSVHSLCFEGYKALISIYWEFVTVWGARKDLIGRFLVLRISVVVSDVTCIYYLIGRA